MGRKSGYTPKLGDKIIELIAEGKSLRGIAEQPGMPDNATISRWGRDAGLPASHNRDGAPTRRRDPLSAAPARSELPDQICRPALVPAGGGAL